MKEKSKTEEQIQTKQTSMYKPDYILKVGGSLLTDKTTEETLSENFSSILSKIQDNPQGVLIHGAGSFGHPHAERAELKGGSRENVLEIHRGIKKLNKKVVNELRENNMKAFPVHPSSFSLRDPDTMMMTEQVRKISEEGFLPVLHGDITVTQSKGFTGLSGDEILAILEKHFQTGHAGFCTSEKGVLDKDGQVMGEISSLEDFHDREIKGADVTGGMRNKVEELVEKNIEAQIFSSQELEGFLQKSKPGTTVKK